MEKLNAPLAIVLLGEQGLDRVHRRVDLGFARWQHADHRMQQCHIGRNQSHAAHFANIGRGSMMRKNLAKGGFNLGGTNHLTAIKPNLQTLRAIQLSNGPSIALIPLLEHLKIKCAHSIVIFGHRNSSTE